MNSSYYSLSDVELLIEAEVVTGERSAGASCLGGCSTWNVGRQGVRPAGGIRQRQALLSSFAPHPWRILLLCAAKSSRMASGNSRNGRTSNGRNVHILHKFSTACLEARNLLRLVRRLLRSGSFRAYRPRMHFRCHCAPSSGFPQTFLSLPLSSGCTQRARLACFGRSKPAR